MDKKKILLVSLGHFSCDVNSGALPAALPYVRAACHLDYQATGGLMFAYSCLSSIIQPFFGLLADRHNKPWFIPLGIILAGCGLAVSGFLTSYWLIFAGVAFSGIGAAFFHPEGARFANRVSGQSKSTGLSIFSIGGNSGFILGPLLVTFFVGSFGLHGMAVFGLMSIVMASILFFAISNMSALKAAPKADSQNLVKAAEESGINPQAAEAELLDAASAEEPEPRNNWHEFSRLTVIIVSRAITFTGCNTFIPFFWVNTLGQTAAQGAMALVVFGACGVCCNILGGILADKYGNVRIIRIAFTLMCPVVLCLGLTDSLLMAWAILPFLGLVIYMPFSSQVVLGQKLLSKNIGFASGVTLGLATSLGGIAQPCLGWIADSYGLHTLFICLSFMGALGATFSYTLNKNN